MIPPASYDRRWPCLQAYLPSAACCEPALPPPPRPAGPPSDVRLFRQLSRSRAELTPTGAGRSSRAPRRIASRIEKKANRMLQRAHKSLAQAGVQLGSGTPRSQLGQWLTQLRTDAARIYQLFSHGTLTDYPSCNCHGLCHCHFNVLSPSLPRLTVTVTVVCHCHCRLSLSLSLSQCQCYASRRERANESSVISQYVTA